MDHQQSETAKLRAQLEEQQQEIAKLCSQMVALQGENEARQRLGAKYREEIQQSKRLNQVLAQLLIYSQEKLRQERNAYPMK